MYLTTNDVDIDGLTSTDTSSLLVSPWELAADTVIKFLVTSAVIGE